MSDIIDDMLDDCMQIQYEKCGCAIDALGFTVACCKKHQTPQRIRQMSPMRMRFFCSKSIPYSLCQSRKAKGPLGEKYWCFMCKRYIIPDRFHTLVIEAYDTTTHQTIKQL